MLKLDIINDKEDFKMKSKIHPLAPFLNTEGNLELMKNFASESDLPEIEIDINRIEQLIVEKVLESLNKHTFREIKEAIAKEVFGQLNKQLKKISI